MVFHNNHSIFFTQIKTHHHSPAELPDENEIIDTKMTEYNPQQPYDLATAEDNGYRTPLARLIGHSTGKLSNFDICSRPRSHCQGYSEMQTTDQCGSLSTVSDQVSVVDFPIPLEGKPLSLRRNSRSYQPRYSSCCLYTNAMLSCPIFDPLS